jgi:hypothetical protein
MIIVVIFFLSFLVSLSCSPRLLHNIQKVKRQNGHSQSIFCGVHHHWTYVCILSQNGHLFQNAHHTNLQITKLLLKYEKKFLLNFYSNLKKYFFQLRGIIDIAYPIICMSIKVCYNK